MGLRDRLFSTAAAAPTPSDGRGGAPNPARTAPATTAAPGVTAAGERFHSRRSAAEFLRLSERSLERLAVEGDGPPFALVGRRVIYFEPDLVAWMRARTVASTSEASAKRSRRGAA